MNDEWDTFKTTELQSAQNYVTMNTVKDRILKVKAAYKGKVSIVHGESQCMGMASR